MSKTQQQRSAKHPRADIIHDDSDTLAAVYALLRRWAHEPCDPPDAEPAHPPGQELPEAA